MPLQITYYGTRGSIPVNGESYLKYGGNTTCVFLQSEKTHIIIDAGTGIRQLGNDLLKTPLAQDGGKLHILFTHTHWDHVQGFPFFVPAFMPKNTLFIYGETKQIKLDDGTQELWDIQRTLTNQQHFMYFPVDTKYMASNKKFTELKGGEEFTIDNVRIRTITLTHPNTTLGFRFEIDGKAYCFCTDLEHNSAMTAQLIQFCKGAHVLAYDCQYTMQEYLNGKVGWGHSTWEIAVEICKGAGVEELHMIHHDPLHDDKRLDEIELEAKVAFQNARMIPDGYSFKL